MNRRRIESLVQDAHAGELDEAGAAALAEVMRRSPEARDIYCQHALLNAELRRHARGQDARPGHVTAASRFARLRQRRRQAVGSLVAAAAVVTLAAAVLAVIFVKPADPSASIAYTPGSIILDASGGALEDASLDVGETIDIRQGVAELDMPAGVRAIIEGPAVCRLTSDSRLRLDGGRGYFHVPPAGRGFRVDGRDFSVIDLGTEFGIDFRQLGRTGVEVVRGRVEVRCHEGRREVRELTAGQAARVTPTGTLTPSRDLGVRFAKRLPHSLPEIRTGFERLENGRITLEGELAASDATLAISRPEAVRLVPGRVGLALEFVGDADLRADWRGIHGDAPRTVSLWVRLPEEVDLRKAPPLAVWGYLGEGWNRKFKLAAVTDAAGRTVPRLSFGETYVNGTTHLADGTWRHLAAVYRGNRADGRPDFSLYIDGRPEPTGPVSPNHEPPYTDTMASDSLPLLIGEYQGSPLGGHPYLRGAIDELRIIAGALGPERIAELANPAPSSPGEEKSR